MSSLDSLCLNWTPDIFDNSAANHEMNNSAVGYYSLHELH